MALEILGTPCAGFDYDGWRAYHLKYPNCYILDWRGVEPFFWVFHGKGASYTSKNQKNFGGYNWIKILTSSFLGIR